MYSRSGRIVVAALVFAFLATPALADIQVNSADHNAMNLGNFTTESETNVARSGSIVVVGYNTSRQAGLLGGGGWNSLSGYAWSNNGGATFTDAGFVPGNGAKLEGDPTLAYDSGGNLYYASIGFDSGGISRIFVSKSATTTTPVTFLPPVVIQGLLPGTAPFQDKELMAVDTTNSQYSGRVYVAWSEFANVFDSNPRLLFAASSSQNALAFSPTLALSPAAGGNHGANPAVGPNGEVYVAWSTFSSFGSPSSTTLNLAKSTNGGASFAPTTIVATYTSTVSNLATGGVNLRTRAFPYLAVDRTPSGSPTSGNLYIVYQARPTSAVSPRSEIFFVRSTDGGTTWSSPRDITSGPAVTYNGDGSGRDNFVPSISVSPVTGHIKVLLYSRREDPANQDIRVYEAGSTDGGVTWYGRPFSAVAFTPSTGYDPLINATYMGDYIHAVADSNGLIGAWGDMRNKCAPPIGALNPCSASGRGDQDAWSLAETDATGVDLFITPWGYVSGSGPYWQTPDIFVLDPNNLSNQVNAKINFTNLLRARVRNLGNAAANGATVTFSYTPTGVGVGATIFKQIGSPVTLSFSAAPSVQVVPINWFLDPNENNGGMWGNLPVSAFDHFCVRVSVAHGADINPGNNDAQNNFVDVTSAGPLKPFKFLVGNPFKQTVRGRLVVSQLPAGYIARVSGVPTQEEFTLEPGAKVRVATLSLARPAGFERARRTQDVVGDVSLVVAGRAVGGFSVRLAKANVVPKKPIVSVRERAPAARSVRPQTTMPQPSPTAEPRVLVAASTQATVRALADQLRQQQLPVALANEQSGIVSSGSIPLTHAQLVAAAEPQFAKSIPSQARGRYLISFAVRALDGQRTELRVSTRIMIDAPELDSPVGQLVPSNGSLEQRQIRLLAQRLKVI